jgi:hypothetical protein
LGFHFSQISEKSDDREVDAGSQGWGDAGVLDCALEVRVVCWRRRGGKCRRDEVEEELVKRRVSGSLWKLMQSKNGHVKENENGVLLGESFEFTALGILMVMVD